MHTLLAENHPIPVNGLQELFDDVIREAAGADWDFELFAVNLLASYEHQPYVAGKLEIGDWSYRFTDLIKRQR